MTVIKNQVANAGGNPIMQQGLLANRPPAGIKGRLYISTDTLVIYRDNGATWVTVGGGGGSTPNLQQVTDVGNETTNSINITSNSILTVVNGSQFTQVYPDEIHIDNGSGRTVSIVNGGIGNQQNDVNYVFTTDADTKIVTDNTYNPTFAAILNCTTITTINVDYTQIGNTVTIYGQIDVTVTAGGALCIVQCNLPTGTMRNAQGVAVVNRSPVYNAGIVGYFDANTLQMEFTPTSAGVNGVYYSVTYRLL